LKEQQIEKEAEIILKTLKQGEKKKKIKKHVSSEYC